MEPSFTTVPHADELEQTITRATVAGRRHVTITAPRQPAPADLVDEGPAAGLLDLIASARPEWHRRANCRGQVSVMFPDETTPAAVDAARRLCANCAVQAECAAEAARWPKSGLHGVWAGTTHGQRTKRRRAPQSASTAA